MRYMHLAPTHHREAIRLLDAATALRIADPNRAQLAFICDKCQLSEEPAQQRVVSLAHGCIAERARTAGTRASDVEL